MTLSFRIMEEIMNVVEKGVSVNLWADKAQKRIDDNPHMGVTSRGKEELERLKEIANLPRDGKSANQVKQEASKEEAQAARKAIEADLKGNKEERDKQEGVVYKKGLIAGDNKGGCLDKWKANKPKPQNINCALDIMEQICDFADNLFELDIENKQNISPNKISKVKKDKDGKDVEVVSVADELFPHDGTAKQQFDKKILDKINDMIEGTGSLEDLIQFVRKGVANKKLAHECLDEAKDAKGYKENMDIANHYDHLYSKEPANSPDGSPNPVAAEWKRKYQEYFDKAMKCHYGDENESKKVLEALSVMNDIVNTILERKNIFGHEEGNRGDLLDDVSQTVTGKTLNQHIENKVNKD